MGYWQNGFYFMGDRIISKKDELSDKELSLMLKRNLEKAYQEIEDEIKFEKELSDIDEFATK